MNVWHHADIPFCFLHSPSTICTYRENRYLLFLTENYAALEILRHYLNDVVRSSVLNLTAHDTPGSDDDGARLLEKMEPFILFGSSFPKDKEYTQVCAFLLCSGKHKLREVDILVKVCFEHVASLGNSLMLWSIFRVEPGSVTEAFVYQLCSSDVVVQWL